MLDSTDRKIWVEDLKLRGRMIRLGWYEVREGLRDSYKDGVEAARTQVSSSRAALRAWWDEPRSLEQRLDDVNAFQQRVRKDGRERARLMRLRGVDQGRLFVAHVRAQAMQQRRGQRMAYAPLMLNYHETKVGQVLALLPEHRIAQMVPAAERLRDAQLKMLERTAAYRDCGLCDRYVDNGVGGQCCSGYVGQWFRPIDGIFRRLLGERAPVWPRFHRDYSRCGYMGERGCVLPPGTRPIICVGYYCDPFRERLTRDGVWQQMSQEFEEIRAAIRQLDFRFNMHRRRLTSSGPTVVDGSIGYLWNKLMSLYAAFDQITPSEIPSGVNAIDGEAIGGSGASPAGSPAGAGAPESTGEQGYASVLGAYGVDGGQEAPGGGGASAPQPADDGRDGE